LGPITIGDNAKIGSGAVVVKPVPPDSTAVGVPARVVRGPHLDKAPSLLLQHGQLPDPIAEICRRFDDRIRELESQVLRLRQALQAVTSAGARAEAVLQEEK
jgi:serine O-acetyltransferase